MGFRHIGLRLLIVTGLLLVLLNVLELAPYYRNFIGAFGIGGGIILLIIGNAAHPDD